MKITSSPNFRIVNKSNYSGKAAGGIEEVQDSNKDSRLTNNHEHDFVHLWGKTKHKKKESDKDTPENKEEPSNNEDSTKNEDNITDFYV